MERLKSYPNNFISSTPFTLKKMGIYVFPCIYILTVNRNGTTYDRLLRKLLEIEPALNLTHIMVDFEKASINALEEHFLAVCPDASSISLKIFLGRSNQRD